ncbi:hypothetical protein EB73_14430 [Mycobacterium sp. SWH-M3]|nr:hypothetical protein EB73_14430 [Mycobacterium sp. SWH-M3]
MIDDESTRLLRVAAAHERWGALDAQGRTDATQAARDGLEAKFLREAGGDPKRAASLRKAHYARMTAASIRARRRGPANRAGATGPSK